MRRHLVVAAALLCGAATGVVVPMTSASAAACTRGTGVTVVVGSSVTCDTNGGGNAESNVRDAGHGLTFVRQQPGFICQVDGAPASSPCVQTPPANAYWAIFVSDGRSGKWSYATAGIKSLDVPKGGWVGLKFQDTSDRVAPGVTPVGAKAPSSGGGSTGGGSTGGGSSSGGTAKKSTPTPSAGATTASPTPSATTPTPTTSTPTPTATASAEARAQSADEVEATSAEQEEQGSSSLVWVAAALAVLLLGGMGTVLWQRRSRGHTH